MWICAQIVGVSVRNRPQIIARPDVIGTLFDVCDRQLWATRARYPSLSACGNIFGIFCGRGMRCGCGRGMRSGCGLRGGPVNGGLRVEILYGCVVFKFCTRGVFAKIGFYQSMFVSSVYRVFKNVVLFFLIYWFELENCVWKMIESKSLIEVCDIFYNFYILYYKL